MTGSQQTVNNVSPCLGLKSLTSLQLVLLPSTWGQRDQCQMQGCPSQSRAVRKQTHSGAWMGGMGRRSPAHRHEEVREWKCEAETKPHTEPGRQLAFSVGQVTLCNPLPTPPPLSQWSVWRQPHRLPRPPRQRTDMPSVIPSLPAPMMNTPTALTLSPSFCDPGPLHSHTQVKTQDASWV